MTKHKAREILERYFTRVTFTSLPVNDEVIYIDEFEQYTFKYLIKIAFDL